MSEDNILREQHLKQQEASAEYTETQSTTEEKLDNVLQELKKSISSDTKFVIKVKTNIEGAVARASEITVEKTEGLVGLGDSDMELLQSAQGEIQRSIQNCGIEIPWPKWAIDEGLINVE